MTAEQLNKTVLNNLKSLEKNEHKRLYDFIFRQKENGAQLSQIAEYLANFGITRQHVDRLLYELVKKHIIVQDVRQNSNIYYVTELAPQSRNMPSWYNQQHFDENYATDLLNYIKTTVQQAKNQVVNMDHIIRIVQNKPQIKQYISESDIETLVQALVYDNQLIQYEDQVSGQTCYQVPSQTQTIQGLYYQGDYFKTIPCGRCQLIQVCENGGAISCRTCQYIKQWLKGKE